MCARTNRSSYQDEETKRCCSRYPRDLNKKFANLKKKYNNLFIIIRLRFSSLLVLSPPQSIFFTILIISSHPKIKLRDRRRWLSDVGSTQAVWFACRCMLTHTHESSPLSLSIHWILMKTTNRHYNIIKSLTLNLTCVRACMDVFVCVHVCQMPLLLCSHIKKSPPNYNIYDSDQSSSSRTSNIDNN